MWIASEIGAMATVVAEFLGGALGVSLLFHVSLLCGLTVTGAVTFAILQLDKGGFRPLELVIGTLVGIIGLSFLCELIVAPPDWRGARFLTPVADLHERSAVPLAVGRLGAPTMSPPPLLHSRMTP